MTRMVGFVERVSGGKRAQYKADTYMIDPAHVGLVIGRSTYTTLLVQGMWIHVAHGLDEVLLALGLMDPS